MKKDRRRRFMWKMKYKYIAAFIGVSVCISFLLSGSYYWYFSRLFETQTKEYVLNMAEQSQNSLELTMGKFDSVILSIQSEEAVQSFLAQIDRGAYSEYEEYLARADVRKVIYADIMWEDSVINVYLESDGGYWEVWEKSGSQVLWDTQKKEQIYNGVGHTVWLGADESGEYMQAGAQINSTRDMKPLGFVIIQVPMKDFEQHIDQYSFVRNGITIIAGDDAELVAGSGYPDAGDYLEELKGLLEPESLKRQVHSIKAGGEQYLVVISRLNYNNWHLITLIPKMNHMEVLYELRYYILAVVFVVLAASFLVILILAERFTKNIKALRSAMEQFGEGDFNIICPVSSNDEIGQLSQHFNMMVYNINDLIDKVYNETMLRQEAELKSLRMQINPHFLYNTLDIMSWISRNRGVPEVGDIAVSLSNIFRYTIRGSAFARLKDELWHIKNYMVIQHYRYGDRIRFEMRVPDEANDIFVLKLLIQPLVENAVIHGIENMENNGVVVLEAERRGSNLHIAVYDNGVGMSQEKIRRILKDDGGLPLEVKESIGLKNVNRRLKLRYGESHGLSIESVLGKGTRVNMVIPISSEPGMQA